MACDQNCTYMLNQRSSEHDTDTNIIYRRKYIEIWFSRLLSKYYTLSLFIELDPGVQALRVQK